ncbi:DUF4192 family protein [Leucobacter komagatae]|uniref:DUF4192 family protein n=1 Tax=Leucobacter komagatae TaxID=55969 RepID=A0A0D0H9C6_9MICO|nr:DUF4192 family protein [Leucobacter komagatae]KIP53820.1 hypothetical protein SD72_01160 [Leucobacter komagatae]
MKAQPTVLRATSSADFLAALPRLTGMTAPESCFVVLFDGKRTLGAARIDLPPLEQLERPGDEIEHWLRQVAEIALKSDAVAVVVNTDAQLSKQPVSSPHGTLTGVLADVLHAAGASVRDALAVGSDGWASFVGTNFPQLHSLDEIQQSPLYDPDHVLLGVDEWRAQHPGRTAEDPDEITNMAAQMCASGSQENRS